MPKNIVIINGVTQIDLTPTTAVASDVANGKQFYLADGTLTTGTASGGGGGVTRETIVPQTTVTGVVGDWVRLTSGSTPSLVDGEFYSYTINGTEYLATGTTNNGIIYLSDILWDWSISSNAIGYDIQYGGIWLNASVAGSYTVKVDKITLSGGGGGSTLIEKSITANGTYNASDDSADGYSKVTVNVSSGSSKNTQTVQSTSRRNNTALGSITSLTCSKAGTYDVYWTCARSSTSQTWGSQLYINDTAYGTENTTWSNHVQNNHLSNVTIPANATVAVYGRSRSGYYIYAPQLSIIEA